MPENPVPALEIDVQTHDDVTTVAPRGRLSMADAARFKTEVKGLLARAPRLVLDLSGVTFMDSSGLGAVMSLYVSARGAKRELQVTHLTKQVRELFRITRVLSLFEPAGEVNVRLP